MPDFDGKREAPSQTDWRATRRYLREQRRGLAQTAARLYPELPRVGASTLLSRPDWLPAAPVALGDVRLEWSNAAVHPATAVPGLGALPVGGFQTYAEAVRTLDPPRLLDNRCTYRLTGALLSDARAILSFGDGMYFDVLNVGEATAHELAHTQRHGGKIALGLLPLRQCIGDPTDPVRRPMPAAITTLTIRHDRRSGEARFLVHWRDPAKVATNGGSYQVAPVGMFQPAGQARADGVDDFDLWRCMAREYSEELLGAAEHENLDYERWPFFRSLQTARDAGECQPYLLGIGVDPLTLATDILTAVVFDAVAFDRLFGGLVEYNVEGRTLLRGDDGSFGTRFAFESVRQLVDREPMQPAGAATLDLAWRHRRLLLVA